MLVLSLAVVVLATIALVIIRAWRRQPKMCLPARRVEIEFTKVTGVEYIPTSRRPLYPTGE